MTCAEAPTCRVALDELTLTHPKRDRRSDGICASPQHHAQNPNSDHERGDAYDVTHDPYHQVDCWDLSNLLVEKRDHRVLYVIWQRVIWRSYDKPGLPAWEPEHYYGTNPHTTHMHVSIRHEIRSDTEDWWSDVFTDADRELMRQVNAKLDEVLRLARDDHHHISGSVADNARLARIYKAVVT
jgi:hypothetical protein